MSRIDREGMLENFTSILHTGAGNLTTASSLPLPRIVLLI